MLIGTLLESSRTPHFTTLFAELDYLDDWLGIFGHNLSRIYDVKAVKAEYIQPEDIMFELSDSLEIGFSFQTKLPINSRNTVEISQKAFLVINSSTELSLYDFYKELERFQKFLTFATQQKVRVCGVTLRSNKDVKEFNEKIYFTEITLLRRQKNQLFQNVHPSTFLLTFKQIRDNFEAIYSSWSKLEQEMTPIINILYDQTGWLESFTENDFLNIIQAIEAYHRRDLSNNTLLKQENKHRLNEIYANLTESPHLAWLKDKLSFSYEPSLKARLLEMFETYGKHIYTGNQEDVNRTLTHIVNTRNYLTHYSKDLEKKKATVKEQLHYTRLIKHLLTILIATKIKIPSEIIEWYKGQFRSDNEN